MISGWVSAAAEDTAVVAGAADWTAATERARGAAAARRVACAAAGLPARGAWARAGAEWEARPVAGPADTEPVGEEESAEATAAPV